MSRLARMLFVALLLAPCALVAADDKKDGQDDPKSSNKDKILGKWKITEPPATTQQEKDDFATLEKVGVYVYLEFRTENVFAVGLSSDNKDLLEGIRKSTPGQKLVFLAKYRLLAGDKVELYGVKDDFLKTMVKDGKATSAITIDKDKMTIKDPDGKVSKLVRMKEAKEKDKPDQK